MSSLPLSLPVQAFDRCVNGPTCDAVLAAAAANGFAASRMRGHGRIADESFVVDQHLGDALIDSLARHYKLAVAGDDLIEVYRYEAGQYIALHVDSPRRIADGSFSNATLLVYLSDDVEGGSTRFPDQSLHVEPVRGRAVLFSHGVPHEARAVIAGTKFVARMSVAVQV